MTDREKAIVMAHTGICMLTGDKFQIFHKYVEDIMGRPIMTHEIGLLANTIKEKAKADFIALCADESCPENPNKWIPVSERLPEEYGLYLVYAEEQPFVCPFKDGEFFIDEVLAWMPLPEPYEPQERSDKE